MIQALISFGVNPNEVKEIHIAVKKCAGGDHSPCQHGELVVRTRLPLDSAIFTGNVSAVETLLLLGVNKKLSTAHLNMSVWPVLKAFIGTRQTPLDNVCFLIKEREKDTDLPIPVTLEELRDIKALLKAKKKKK